MDTELTPDQTEKLAQFQVIAFCLYRAMETSEVSVTQRYIVVKF